MRRTTRMGSSGARRSAARAALGLQTFDPSDYLRNEQDTAIFLSDALEEGELSGILICLFHACRARGMGKVARAAGLGRESLYKALAPRAHPRFETILKLVHALGLVMEVKPNPNKAHRRAAAAAMAVAARTTKVQVRRKSA
jgi:probable addiction module antidote protein